MYVCVHVCVYSFNKHLPRFCHVLSLNESLGAETRSTDGQGGPPLDGLAMAQASCPITSHDLLAPGALAHASGCRVRIPAEVLILNSIVLPHKELSRSFTNQIIL